MRYYVSIAIMSCLSFTTAGCTSSTEPSGDQVPVEAKAVSAQVVEAACASCIYKMDGVEDCELAVKIDGTPYLVSGIEFDTHEAGLCEAAQSAEIRGEIEGDRFVATGFELEQ